MIKLAVAGASGRMGRLLIAATVKQPDTRCCAALVRSGHALLGVDAGELTGVGRLDLALTDDAADAVAACDVLIDFTRPTASLELLRLCRAAGRAMVIGTTGFDPEQKAELKDAAAEMPLLLAANTSVGVNLCVKLAQIAARALGEQADIEILEAHHRHKVDAPSGTALWLGEAVAEALGGDLAERAVYTREGNTGERRPGSIGFSVVRGGDIVGEHTVLFAAQGERIEITHRTADRMNFAAGALRAARWLAGRPAGWYGMRDVLDL